MKILVVEDDFTSRLLLHDLLKEHGTIHVAVNGREAVEAVRLALAAGEPYDLVCLDIMMPEMDGQEALRGIRELEEAGGILSNRGAKIVMTTVLDDPRSVMKAFSGLCDAYLYKPIDKARLHAVLRQVNLFG